MGNIGQCTTRLGAVSLAETFLTQELNSGYICLASKISNLKKLNIV